VTLTRIAIVAVALAVTTMAAPASADAAMKGCSAVKGRPGGDAVWRAHHIRVSNGIKCKRARQNIRTWIGFGGMMDHPRALAPWRCKFGVRPRCKLRTSFGGTKPMRTYRLRFRIKSV
jgi:hypothetical protein